MARPQGIEINHWALAEFREVRGLSRSEVAVRADLSTGHYSDIENGKARPSLETLHRIAAALAVRPLSLRTDIARLPDPEQEPAA